MSCPGTREEPDDYKLIYDGGGGLAAGFGERNGGKDEESRFSRESRVKDTFDARVWPALDANLEVSTGLDNIEVGYTKEFNSVGPTDKYIGRVFYEDDIDKCEGHVGMWEKNWIRSIIKDKSLDVIRLQETKCRVVDDFWIEDIWGGKGYGYSQLPANGNLGALWNDDRFNSQVNTKEIMEFNEFINNTRLIEIPMGGRKFTRVSDDRMKFSKLDCFLLNEKFNEMWGNLSVVALDRKLSDHCPIVIKDVELDFGPKPFRVFNIWLEESDFSKVVEVAWKREGRFGGHKKKMEKLKNDAIEWELEAKKRVFTDKERDSWLEARKQWQ
ncbi:transposon TX1 [Tanacetum coccineum]